MIKKNATFSAIMNVVVFDILSKLFAVLCTYLLIRILSIENYSLYSKFSSISSLLFGILGSGICLSFVRFFVYKKSENDANANYLYYSSFILVSIIFVLALLFVPLFSKYYKVPELTIFLSYLYALVLSYNQLFQSYFQANNLFLKSGVVSLIKTFLIFLFVFILGVILKVENINLILLSIIVVTIFAYILSRIIFRKKFNIERKFKINILKEMVFECFWLILYRFLLTSFEQMDIFMINLQLGDYELSCYSTAYKYYSLLLTLLSSIQVVLRVKTSSSDMANSITIQKQFTKNWIKRSWFISVIVVVIGYFVSPILIKILNSGKYLESIAVFRILLIGCGLSYVTAPNMGVMMSTGKHKLLCLIAFFALLANITGNYFLIPIMGINGAALVTIGSQFILNFGVTIYILLRRENNAEQSNL